MCRRKRSLTLGRRALSARRSMSQCIFSPNTIHFKVGSLGGKRHLYTRTSVHYIAWSTRQSAETHTWRLRTPLPLFWRREPHFFSIWSSGVVVPMHPFVPNEQEETMTVPFMTTRTRTIRGAAKRYCRASCPSLRTRNMVYSFVVVVVSLTLCGGSMGVEALTERHSSSSPSSSTRSGTTSVECGLSSRTISFSWNPQTGMVVQPAAAASSHSSSSSEDTTASNDKDEQEVLIQAKKCWCLQFSATALSSSSATSSSSLSYYCPAQFNTCVVHTSSNNNNNNNKDDQEEVHCFKRIDRIN